jgi:diadenosine tetraphosphate (Ap4A) HIT family hydrolase
VTHGSLLRESPDGLTVAFLDAYPLAAGHTLVVPRRHEPNLCDLTSREATSLWTLVTELTRELMVTYAADGLTVGVNVGTAAGQTVSHVHVHIIPRHLGDVPDPRGGVRWVIPQRAAYWEGE